MKNQIARQDIWHFARLLIAIATLAAVGYGLYVDYSNGIY